MTLSFDAALDIAAPLLDDAKTYRNRRLEWENSAEGLAVAEAIREHAATAAGARAVKKWRETFVAAGNKTHLFHMLVQREYLAGLEIGKERKEAEKIAKKVAQRLHAQEHGWREGPERGYEWMHPTKNLKPGKSCLEECPDSATFWLPADNPARIPAFKGDKNPSVGAPVGPGDVTTGSNSELFFRPTCGHVNRGRVNLVIPRYMKTGRLPDCTTCQPQKQSAFASAKDRLAPLLEAVANDPSAFALLSPSLQYMVFARLGYTDGRTMERDLALNIVHGDITLDDVVAAANFTDLEGRLSDLDDDAELAVATTVRTDTGPRDGDIVARAFNVAGILGVLGDDPALIEQVIREGVEALWGLVMANEQSPDRVLAQIAAGRHTSAHADLVAARFFDDYDRVVSAPLPESYVGPFTPTLSQRRFMLRAVEDRRVATWSGTGAGKTLAMMLAVMADGARNVMVVAPNAVVAQWARQFASTFDGVTVRKGLPEPGTSEGVRVWVANYEKFQVDSDAVSKTLADTAGVVDAVVFDEVHKVKSSNDARQSRRRRVLEKFVAKAAAHTPDLMVLGASATPVVNDLSEAASVLRLVLGPSAPTFATKPTIRNAALAHRHMSAAGFRHLPNYAVKLCRNDVAVDVTSHLPALKQRLTTLKHESPQVTPAMMERALLPTKLDRIAAACTGPTVVYTHYVDGMVGPIADRLAAEGLRVATYTGQQSEVERAEVIAAFRNGNIDVIVGSQPIATGVDGLQDVCRNLVVASMPWTAADFDQLTGRLLRQGQSCDVTVTVVLAEAHVGGFTWSWCRDNRLARIQFKRSIADAATDGVIPEGFLPTQDKSAEEACAALLAA